jgi:hypothetical protein
MAMNMLRMIHFRISAHLSVFRAHLNCGCALLSFAQSRCGAAACAHFHACTQIGSHLCTQVLATKNARKNVEINSCLVSFQWYPCCFDPMRC